jgi:hypothetical protein
MKKLIKRLFGWIYPELRAELGLIKKPKKTKIDKWKEYAENLVIESGIDLENVLIHNYGNWGVCGRKAYWYNDKRELCFSYDDDVLGELKIPLPLPDNPYIAVPEIKCYWTFRAWIHEVGHYIHRHFNHRDKPTYLKEFEAEVYCLKMCKDSGLCDAYDMIDIKYSCVAYLHTHIDKAIANGDIKYKECIPQEMYDFIYKCDYMKEEMEKKNLPSKEELNKELELIKEASKTLL